ncbi:MAG: fumarylacetoacetase [Alphaproteobacteria bacterium]|nr:fumarylacetoacetase [Alphaproteobacteria bacterium]
MIDATHDPSRRSWVESANEHPHFPIQNLPLGVFSKEDESARGGIAIGDEIFDLRAALEAGLFGGEARAAAEAAAGPMLNPLLALGATARQALRRRVSDILDANGADRARIEAARDRLLHLADDCTMHVPAAIGDYTDFFAGIHHARNGGKLNRPDNPLAANYKYVPVAYHSRASSIRASGTDVRRPKGQRLSAGREVPEYGPCERLDYEMELGIWIGPGNAHGEPIPIARAAEHIAGFCLLNDWSARDIQTWESQPLGPFLAKSFQTSISPWIVTPEALVPFRIAQPARPEGDPAPLPYLFDAADQACGGLSIDLEVLLLTEAMRDRGLPPHRMSRANARELYWTVAQMVAHHTAGGCDLRPGDLFGSGTISDPDPSGFGALLEITEAGRKPVVLSSGETRTFLQDGDEVIFRGTCRADGFVPIGFGECRGRVVG